MNTSSKIHVLFISCGVLLILAGVTLTFVTGAGVSPAAAAEQDAHILVSDFGVLPPQLPPAQGDPGRGGYIFALAGGCGCHMGQAGELMAGGMPFEGPFGTVYAPNITPDPATGIGNWSDQEIIDAIRLGKTPEGEQLFPVMPYPALSSVSDQDVQDLVAFLRTLPPIENEVPERELNVPVPPFEPPAPAPETAPTGGVERGAYIVNGISHCGDCHTPLTADGSPDFSRQLAGGFIEGQITPNITPHEATGIGSWSEEDIATLLQTGERPNGTPVTGLMALSVQGGYNQMTDEDAMAVAMYLKTIPPVENIPQPPEMGEMAEGEGEAMAPADEESMAGEEAMAAEAAPAAEEPATLPPSGGESPLPYVGLLLAVVGLVSLSAGVVLYRKQVR